MKPPTFDGEVNKIEESEALLLRMKKYFRVHNYSKNMKARVDISSMKVNFDIWYENLRNVKVIRENRFSWRIFEKCFREKYLPKRYYNNKAKNFYEHKFRKLSVDEYTARLLELLMYLPYIRDVKTKIQKYISGLP